MRKPRALPLLVTVLALVLPAGLAGASGGRAGGLESRLVTVLEDGQTVESVLVADGIAYAGGLNGIGIYDVHDPADARGIAGTDGTIRGMAIDGSTLVVQEGFDQDSTLVVLDVLDPAHPAVDAWIQPPAVPGAPPSDFPPQLSFEGPVAVRDGLLYAVSEDYYNPDLFYRALSVYDVGNPADPTLVGQVALRPSSQAEQLVLAGDYAYLSSTSYLEPVDVSAPAHPVAGTPISTAGDGVAVDGQLLYSCPGIPGAELEVYSLEDPGHPSYRGTIDAPSYLMTCSAVAVTHPVAGKSFLLVAWQAEGLQWLSVYDVTPPIRVGDASLLMNKGQVDGIANNSVSDVEVDGSYVYTAQWYAGVRVSFVDWASAARAAPSIVKVPGRDRYVLTRKAGVATWRFGALLRSPAGDPVVGKTVRLQRMLGGGGWTTVATATTDDLGAVVKKLVFRHAGTTSWRWSSPADSAWLAVSTSRTTVVVR